MLTPTQVQRRNEEREKKSTETRNTEALEQIADAMFDMKLELMTVNRHLGMLAQGPSKSAFGR